MSTLTVANSLAPINFASINTLSTLVVFDSRLSDVNVLYEALLPGTSGFTINSTEDALPVITRLLAETGAKNLAIVAHGEPGVIHLGREPIDLGVLNARSGLLQEWCVDEISLYSCEVGANTEFVSSFGRFTGANVASAKGKVGSVEQGGTWNLEQENFSPSFALELIKVYQHTLAISGVTYTGISASDTFLSATNANSSFTIAGTLTNTATSGNDVLIGIYSSTGVLLHRRTVNSTTSSFSASFDLNTVVGTYEGGIIFRFWQGSDSNNNNNTSANYTGAVISLPAVNRFADNVISVSIPGAVAASLTNVDFTSPAYTLDTVAPTVTITDNVTGTANLATASIAYTYTFNEAVTGLAVGDFTVTNGSVSSVTGSGTTWIVNVTPAANVVSGNISLVLANAAVIDAAGNPNVTVTNSAQAIDTVAPTITSGTTGAVNENTAISTVIYTAAALGSNTYSLSGADAGLLSINAATGVVTLLASANFETKPTYSFNVVATDAANNAATQAIVVNVGNLDEVAPAITSGGTGAINENAETTTVIYTAASTDGGDIATGTTAYSLSGADATLLSIDAVTGEVTLLASANFETKPTYSFNVVATDAANNATTQAVVVNVGNLDEVAPTITSGGTGAVNENAETTTVIYTAASTDGGDIATGNTAYSLSGADATLLSIDAVTGEVTLLASANFETKPTYSFNVVATDAANNATTQAVVVSVDNLDEVAPAITSGGTGAVNENAATTTVIYTAASTDGGDIATGTTAYSLSGADADLLNIDAVTGEVTLLASANFETKPTYSFNVVATDAANNATTQAVVVNVGNLDEVAPAITSGGTGAINENAETTTVIYTAASTDGGDIATGNTTYSLSGADADLLNIDAVTGEVTLIASANFETKPTYSFNVVATDAANNAATQAVVVNVGNLDEVALTITSGGTGAVNENAETSTVIYTAASTDGGDIATGNTAYSLSGADATLLSIDEATGVVTLLASADFETKPTYSFNVVATDAANNAATQAVVVNVGNLDEVAPTITSGGTGAVNENAETSTVIYTAASTDGGDIATGNTTYSLSGADATLLSIDEATGVVTLLASADFETKPTYSFNVVATDAANNAATQAVVVNVGNLDEVAPTITSGGTGAVNENTETSTVIYTAVSTDGGDIATGNTTYSLSGADATLLSIDEATGVVTLLASADFETKPTYSFNVVATDAANNAATQAVVVSVGNLDEVAPTITSGGTGAVNENAETSTVIYTAASTDGGDIATGTTAYSLSGADADLLNIDAVTGEVTLIASANFETKPTYSFNVVATDAANNAATQAVVVSVGNLDEVAPTITSGGTGAVNENAETTTVIYTAASTDGGDIATGNTTYSLSGADATLLSIDEATGEVTLIASANFETKPTYSFNVVATDAANNAATQAVVVNVGNLDEVAPTITSGGTGAVNENAETSTVIYTAASTDGGDIATGNTTYSLSGADATLLSIDEATGEVTLIASANFETKPTYSFNVVATDAANNAATQAVVVSVGNLDEVATGGVFAFTGSPTLGNTLTATLNEATDVDGIGITSIVYKWQQLVGDSWTDISGATNASLTFNNNVYDDQQVRVIATTTDSLNGTTDFISSSQTINNDIDGDENNNTLIGTDFNDVVNGYADNDYLNGGLGNDILNGGDNNDILDGAGDASGTDIFNGGKGDDTYGLYSPNTVINENLNEGNDTVWTVLDNYTLADNVENLYLVGALTGNGNSGDNLIVGYGANAQILNGGLGNDSLNGGDGNDVLDGYGDNSGTDIFTGGTGDDIYGVYSANTTIIENIGAENGNDTVWTVVNNYALADNVENLYVVGALTGNGNSSDNLIVGYGANAQILNGGLGNDSLNGGDGNDVLDGYGDNSGADIFTGGTGDDIYGVYSANTTIIENVGAENGNDTVWTVVNNYTLADNVENLYVVGALTGNGNSGDNLIVGYGANAQILNGGLGNDSLNGGDGNDVLDGYGDNSGTDIFTGGAGDDIYGVYSASTIIIEDAGADNGNDTVWTIVNNYTLADNVENLYLVGALNGNGNSSDNLIVGYGADAQTLNGGDGNDTLDGGAGADIITGGNGTDIFTFLFTQSTATAADRITDFQIGIDRLEIFTPAGVAASPNSFSRAGDDSASTDLSSLATGVYANADGAGHALAAGGAAFVVSTGAISGTYVVIDDGDAVFNAASDLVINITGYSGTLPTNFYPE